MIFESRDLDPPDLHFGNNKTFNLKDEDVFENYIKFLKIN